MSFTSTWMPLFGDEFWDSERVADMDGDAVALYLWLLWRQFKNGSLPPPEKLARLSHRWQRQWDHVWPQVESCFDVLEDGRLENPKCAEVRKAALARSRKATKNGSKGGRPPKQRESSSLAVGFDSLSDSDESANALAKPTESSERKREEKREEETPTVFAADAAPQLSDSSNRTAGTQSPHETVLAWFEAQYREATGKRYAFEGAKDGRAIKELLERAGDDGVAGVVERGKVYFADPFHREKSGLSLTRFLAAWNALAKAPPASSAPSSTSPAPVTRASSERQRREREIERAWAAAHTVETEMPRFDGNGTVKRQVVDAKYPGHEAAERELIERGLLPEAVTS